MLHDIESESLHPSATVLDLRLENLIKNILTLFGLYVCVCRAMCMYVCVSSCVALTANIIVGEKAGALKNVSTASTAFWYP